MLRDTRAVFSLPAKHGRHGLIPPLCAHTPKNSRVTQQFWIVGEQVSGIWSTSLHWADAGEKRWRECPYVEIKLKIVWRSLWNSALNPTHPSMLCSRRWAWGMFSSWLASRDLGTERCSYLARVGPVVRSYWLTCISSICKSDRIVCIRGEYDIVIPLTSKFFNGRLKVWTPFQQLETKLVAFKEYQHLQLRYLMIKQCARETIIFSPCVANTMAVDSVPPPLSLTWIKFSPSMDK